MSVEGFLITMIVGLLDPISLIGYVAAAFLRPWWAALIAAAGWAVAVTLLVVQLGGSFNVAPRIAGAILATSIFRAIITAIRDRRATP